MPPHLQPLFALQIPSSCTCSTPATVLHIRHHDTHFAGVESRGVSYSGGFLPLSVRQTPLAHRNARFLLDLERGTAFVSELRRHEHVVYKIITVLPNFHICDFDCILYLISLRYGRQSKPFAA